MSGDRFERTLYEPADAEELPNVEESIQMDVNPSSTFTIIASKIYSGPEAGIRESITNSATSIHRAVREGYLGSLSEGIITFDLRERDGGLCLRISDNGVGATKSDINSMATVGEGTVGAENPDLVGQFGMGFYSLWMLVGVEEGSFIMSTNPRGVDEGPITGIWSSESFDVPESDILSGLGPDEFGLEYEIFLKDSIGAGQIIDWVEKYSKWTTVPVRLRVDTQELQVDEEYPPVSLTDKYEQIENGEASISDVVDRNTYWRLSNENDLEYVVIDNEYVTVVNSNITRNGRIICVNYPTEVKGITLHKLGCVGNTTEIRLKTETPVVIDGPNQGKFVEKKGHNLEGFNSIPEDEVHPEDVVTPSPTGSRDYLDSGQNFESWVNKRIQEQYFASYDSPLLDIETKDDVLSLTSQEVQRVFAEIRDVKDKISDYNHKESAVRNAAKAIGTDIKKEAEDALLVLQQRVSVAPEGADNVSRKQNRRRKIVADIWEKQKDGARVFMASRVTQKKAEFVWDAEGDHIVVRVDERQPKFERILGWERLHELDLASDLEMPDSKRQNYLDGTSSSSNITVHIGSHGGDTKKLTVEQIKKGEELDNVSTLVLFKRGRTSITENKQLIRGEVAGASVTNDQFEELKHLEITVSGEEILDRPVVVESSDGTKYDLEDEVPSYVYTHVLNSSTVETFRRDKVMKGIRQYLGEEYLPISEEEAIISGLNRTWRDNKIGVGDDSTHSKKFNSLTGLYAAGVLEDSEKKRALIRAGIDWKPGKEIVDDVKSD